MESVASRGRNGRAGERGFALVVAILALMLLTFLGLTLAATTSTELQIATNHRWSEQAYYNAEAGLEMGKRVLMTANWQALLWPVRASAPITPADPDVSALVRRPDRWGVNPRDAEGRECDPVANAGYGVVLDDGTPAAPYQSVSTVPEAGTVAPCAALTPGCYALNGTFTLWVRYRLRPDPGTGQLAEDPEVLILTSEGTAPYAGDVSTSTFVRARRAVRVLEVALRRFTPARCGKDQAQAGSDAAGSGMVGCTTAPTNLAVPGADDMTGTGNEYTDRR